MLPVLFEDRTKNRWPCLGSHKKPMWGEAVGAIGSALTSALPGILGGPLAAWLPKCLGASRAAAAAKQRTPGPELTKRIVRAGQGGTGR